MRWAIEPAQLGFAVGLVGLEHQKLVDHQFGHGSLSVFVDLINVIWGDAVFLKFIKRCLHGEHFAAPGVLLGADGAPVRW